MSRPARKAINSTFSPSLNEQRIPAEEALPFFRLGMSLSPYVYALQRVENGLKNGGSFETEGLGRNPLLLSYFQVVMCSFQVSFM